MQATTSTSNLQCNKVSIWQTVETDERNVWTNRLVWLGAVEELPAILGSVVAITGDCLLIIHSNTKFNNQTT